MGHAPKARVIFENDNIRITRRRNNGRDDPARIKIEMLAPRGTEERPWVYRRLDLTLDELFDLTEELDDICDEIEDREERKSR